MNTLKLGPASKMVAERCMKLPINLHPSDKGILIKQFDTGKHWTIADPKLGKALALKLPGSLILNPGITKEDVEKCLRSVIDNGLKGSESLLKEKNVHVDFLLGAKHIGLEDIGALKDETIHYQANLLAHVSEAIIATDAQYNIKFWNKAAEKQYGWTASEVIGHPMENFIKNDYLGGSLESILQKIKRYGHWQGEVTQNRRDGVRIPILSTVSIVKDNNNQPVGFIAVNRDITERKKLEDEIRLMSHLLDIAPASIDVIDMEGNIIQANNTAYMELGYSKEEYMKMKLSDIDTPQTAKLIVKRIEEIKKNGFASFEVVHRAKDGSHIPCQAYVKQIMLNGKPFLLSASVNITERKKLEQSLRDKEQMSNYIIDLNRVIRNSVNPAEKMSNIVNYLAGILNASRISISKPTVDGFELVASKGLDAATTDKINVGSAETDILTEAVKIFQGKTLVYNDPKNSDKFDPILKILSKRKIDPSPFAISVHKNHAKMADCVLSIRRERPFDENEAILLRDFANIIGAEMEIDTLNETIIREHQLATLGLVSKKLAHDINNKLAILTGDCQILLAENNVSGNTKELAESTLKHLGGIADLVYKLRSMSGNIEMKPQVLSMSDMLADIKNTYRKLLPDTSVIASIEPKLHVNGDATLLSGMIQNLIINAANAMSKDFNYDGKKSKGILIKLISTADNIILTISDNGPGIHHKILPKIFDPGFTTAKSLNEGSGWGLAIVKQTIEMHGGTINVRSKSGKGTTFTITLPRSTNGPIPVNEKQNSIIKGKGQTILVIDDEESIANILKKQLGVINYKVLIASNGLDGLKIYKERTGNIDLVMLDMIMPGMDGPAVLEEIRKIDPRAKILIQTGQMEGEGSTAAIDKADGLIRKPFDIIPLSQIISDTLGSTGKKTSNIKESDGTKRTEKPSERPIAAKLQQPYVMLGRDIRHYMNNLLAMIHGNSQLFDSYLDSDALGSIDRSVSLFRSLINAVTSLIKEGDIGPFKTTIVDNEKNICLLDKLNDPAFRGAIFSLLERFNKTQTLPNSFLNDSKIAKELAGVAPLSDEEYKDMLTMAILMVRHYSDILPQIDKCFFNMRYGVPGSIGTLNGLLRKLDSFNGSIGGKEFVKVSKLGDLKDAINYYETLQEELKKNRELSIEELQSSIILRSQADKTPPLLRSYSDLERSVKIWGEGFIHRMNNVAVTLSLYAQDFNIKNDKINWSLNELLRAVNKTKDAMLGLKVFIKSGNVADLPESFKNETDFLKGILLAKNNEKEMKKMLLIAGFVTHNYMRVLDLIIKKADLIINAEDKQGILDDINSLLGSLKALNYAIPRNTMSLPPENYLHNDYFKMLEEIDGKLKEIK